MNTQPQRKRPKPLTIALLAAGMALSDTTSAAETQPAASPTDLVNQWAQMVIYAITPYCQILSSGLRVCQPVGLVGPAPNSPAATYQPLVRVPLAPPSVQPPGMQPFAFPPFGVYPFLPTQATPYLPRQSSPASAQQLAAAPAADAQASAKLPSIVPSAPQDTPPASAMQEPSRAQPPAQTPSASTETTAVAVTLTTTPAPAVPGEPIRPAPTEAAAAPTAGDAAIARFEFDRAELTEAGRAALDAWLARHPKGTPVVVTGHADRLGPAPYNLDLSRRRAEAVRDYLLKKGMDARLITLVARGEAQPLVHCKGGASPATIACLAPNRRVVVEP